MEIEKAIEIITALAKGVSPRTGNPLPAKSRYRSPRTIKALLMAIDALEEMEIVRMSQLTSNAGKYWEEDEDERLITAYKSGKSIKRIADILGRTVGGIRARLIGHGLIEDKQGTEKIIQL